MSRKVDLIQQIGTPQEVFDTPRNIFVAGFIGTPQMNFFDATLQKEGDDYFVTVDNVDFEISEEKQNALKVNNVEPQQVTLGVRPEHLSLASLNSNRPCIKASIDVSEMMGSSVHLHVKENSRDVVLVLSTVDLPEEYKSGFQYGSEVRVTFMPDVIQLFNTEGNSLLQ